VRKEHDHGEGITFRTSPKDEHGSKEPVGSLPNPTRKQKAARIAPNGRVLLALPLTPRRQERCSNAALCPAVWSHVAPALFAQRRALRATQNLTNVRRIIQLEEHMTNPDARWGW